MQKHKILNIKPDLVLALIAILLVVSSCRTMRPLPVFEVKPMTALKVMRKVERETPLYTNYQSKKVSFEYGVNDDKMSFSGQFKIKRNKCIIISIRKLSVPLGRGLLSPDSIVVVNYFEKNYLKGDFADIKKLLGINLDYNLVQALLTADISKFVKEEDFDKDLYSTIDSQMYRLDSRFDPRSNPSPSSVNLKQPNRTTKRTDDTSANNFSFWVDPQFFVVRKLVLNDSKHNQNIVIHYNDYQVIGRSLFPQEVSFDFSSQNRKVSFLIKLSKTSVNSDYDFSFSVPEKFEKSKLNGL
jgi:hypothetical protein